MCGDVESNPGPKQSTLTEDGMISTESPQSMKLRNGNKTSGANIDDTRAPFEQMLKEMKQLNGKMDNLASNLNTKINNLNGEVQKLRSEAKVTNDKMKSLESENKQLNEKIDRLENKLDSQQGQLKRDNLIFQGIKQDVNETWDDSEEKVKHFIKDKLNIADNIEFERVHRMTGSRVKPQPIIAKFSHFKDRSNVLKNARINRSSLDAGMRVGEDFSDLVREKRRKLWPSMQNALEEGKRATMRYDKLIIEGEVYIYDLKTQTVVTNG
uniref:Sporulation-specific protein 15-like n=1 Tax=Saccoglossus kowalevskii TaxID=10224 RepID=A0ABM0MI92_SACKO|nr:PREDICTED: sporulation-specific protein 15-like [Saccoglossus kowalevskii]